MSLSHQAPGFSQLLKNNRIVAFEELLPGGCQEIAQQSSTHHPSLSTLLPRYHEWVHSTPPRIKSRAFLAQIPKGKVKILACCPVHHSMWCNLIFVEDCRSITPKEILVQIFPPSMQILSDFAHVESEAIDQCCPEEGGDLRISYMTSPCHT